MYFELRKPSIFAIRSNLILEGIAKSFGQSTPINIFATGRANVGKTTLGNSLIGEEYFTVTGRQNTTDEINLIEFPNGLRYFDLPGVDSDDRLENYNRTFLGMKQAPNFPQVDQMTLAMFRSGQQPYRQSISHDDHEFSPDLIFYVIAPHKQMSRSESLYLYDLLENYSNVVYILNCFVAKEDNERVVQENDIDNVKSVIREVHQAVHGSESIPAIVKLNCLTGEGIGDLLQVSERILGGEKAKVFSGLITYQHERAVDEYWLQVKKELIKIFAHIANQKPSSGSVIDSPLFEGIQAINQYLSDLGYKTALLPENLIHYAIEEVMESCSEHFYEDVYIEVEKSEDIYNEVPKYKKVRDDDNPIYELRRRGPNDLIEFIGSVFGDNHYKYVITGYRKKKVFTGYKKVFSHTVSWKETQKTGEKKLVKTIYRTLGEQAIYSLAALSQLMINNESSTELYKKTIKAISTKTNGINDFPENIENITMHLEKNIDNIFNVDFAKNIEFSATKESLD